VDFFDRVLKVMASDYSEVFFSLAFPGQDIRVLERQENVELIVPERRVDFVQRIEHQGQQFLIHLEFQLRWHRDLPRRMFVYSALLTESFQQPVISLLVLLRRTRRRIPDYYAVKLGERAINRFSFGVLPLWEYEEAIWAGDYPELAPLLILISRQGKEQILQREKEIILGEKEERKRADLLALAAMVASRFIEDRDFLREFFKEEVKLMRGRSFIEDWIIEEREKARKEALKEGYGEAIKMGVEALRDIVVAILEERLGVVPEDITQSLGKVENIKTLKLLAQKAIKSKDIDEFRKNLLKFTK